MHALCSGHLPIGSVVLSNCHPVSSRTSRLLANLFLPGNMHGEPLAGLMCEYFERSPSFAVILSHSRQCKFEVLVIYEFSAIRLLGRAIGDEFSMLQHILDRLKRGPVLSDCLGNADMAHLFGCLLIRARNTGLTSQCVLNSAYLEGSEAHDKVSTVFWLQGLHTQALAKFRDGLAYQNPPRGFRSKKTFMSFPRIGNG